MAATDYYPLAKGLVLAYSSDSVEGPSTFKDECLAVAVKGDKTTATFRKTVEEPGKPPKVNEFTVTRDSKGVYRYGEKELGLPVKLGKKWTISPREYKITSLTETITVPAGTFKDCLEISYLVAGGDGGSGQIYFAPGVGMIRTVCAEEDDSYKIDLTRYSK